MPESRTQIIIHGCTGRMGRLLCEVATNTDLNLIGAVTQKTDPNLQKPLSSVCPQCGPKYDHLRLTSKIPTEAISRDAPCALIDFSNPEALDQLLDTALRHKIPLIIGTTGYSETQLAAIKKTAQQVPILQAANFSLGVSLLRRLCKQAAETLGRDFEVEIVETHHNKKKDAPSGTALSLVEAVCDGKKLDPQNDVIYGRHGGNCQRSPNEIGVHALRYGSIVGEHTVIFGSDFETVELSHRAVDRRLFAKGALKAALWLASRQPGLYAIEDMLFPQERASIF